LVHQDVVAISQSLDKLIVRYMQLKNQEEYIQKKEEGHKGEVSVFERQ
jgi:hypothetical protein